LGKPGINVVGEFGVVTNQFVDKLEKDPGAKWPYALDRALRAEATRRLRFRAG
jgi:hypothetical protein